MVKELDEHHKNKHWKLIPESKIWKAKTVKAILAFERKRRPYWISIRMMLTISIMHNIYTTGIDFMLAFPQADVEATIYMEIPLGCQATKKAIICDYCSKTYVVSSKLQKHGLSTFGIH